MIRSTFVLVLQDYKELSSNNFKKIIILFLEACETIVSVKI